MKKFMTVRELISKLSVCDPEAKVVYTTYWTNESGTTWDDDHLVLGLVQSDHGKKGMFVELKDYGTD